MAGFGSPFAITPFGEGSPASQVAPPTKPAERAAYIDPMTRDYVLDSEGERARMPVVRQQMLLAIMTLLGSSSVARDRGIRPPRKITEDVDRQMRNAVTDATRSITDAGRARIKNIAVVVLGTGRVQTTISYDDLTLGEEGVLVV